MKCPKCSSEELVQSPCLGDMPLDHCVGCGGIWFDKGELVALLQRSQGEAPVSLEHINPRPVEIRCPRCGEAMARGGLVNPLLLVDKCQACGGTWLDPSELDLLKKLLGLTGGETKAEGLSRPEPKPVPAPPAPKTGHRVLGGILALAGFIGVTAEVYEYISPAERMPFPQSTAMGVAITVISAVLFVVGGYLFGKRS